MTWFALVAETTEDSEMVERRSAPRPRMRLESVVSTARPAGKAVVLNMSEAGLMIHAYDDLAVDEIFEVVLPQVGSVEAQVAWKRNTLYGCQFLSPITQATISAALLKAQPDASRGAE